MTRSEVSRDCVLEAARRVIAAQVVGVLSTIDQGGHPHMRMMAGVVRADAGFELLSITARGSRKLDHLAANPQICWLFADSHGDEIVTLHGTMQVLESQTRVEPVWQKLEIAARKYAMNLLSEPENLWFVGLKTTVQSVEYMCPQQGLTHPVIYKID